MATPYTEVDVLRDELNHDKHITAEPREEGDTAPSQHLGVLAVNYSTLIINVFVL